MSSKRARIAPARPPVEVRASTRRRSTVSASWEDGRIVVLVPSRLGVAERDAVVDELVQRLLRRAPMLHSDDVALQERSVELADLYLDGVRAHTVRWVNNQKKRWGSCCPSTGHIRISNRLRPVPEWVLDAVIVHELAHLIIPTHSKQFRALANRYPRMKEADTFLHGFAVGLETERNPAWIDPDPEAEDSEFDADDVVDPTPPELPARPTPAPSLAAPSIQIPRRFDHFIKVDQSRLFDLPSR